MAGAVVGHIHDLHHARYMTQCCIPLLRACILDRRFAEYEEAASYNLREIIDTFPGGQCSMDTACWAERMEEELWRNFVMYGLDLRGVPRRAPSSSSSSDDFTGDEMGLMQNKPHQKMAQAGPQPPTTGPIGLWGEIGTTTYGYPTFSPCHLHLRDSEPGGGYSAKVKAGTLSTRRPAPRGPPPSEHARKDLARHRG